MSGAPSVLIVGAGPTGLALAVDLLRRGVSCRLVDRLEAPAGLAKACGIMPRTLEVLDGLGALEPFLARGVRVTAVAAYHDGGDTLAEAHFDHLDSSFPFILALEQFHTEAFLRARLEELGGRIERGVELTALEEPEGEAVRVRLRGPGGEEELRVPFVVGCDGAHSTVRHALGLAFPGAAYPEAFLLGHLHLEWPIARDRMCVLMNDDGMLFATPTSDGRWLVAADLAGDQQALVHEGAPTLADLDALFARRAPAGTRGSDLGWSSFFHVHHRQVGRYSVGRVFLCGDAAHVHSPLGGQGMNTGIQDAVNLGWKLALVASGAASPALLDSYDAERRPVGAHVLAMTHRIQTAASFRHPVLRHVRDTLLGAAAHLEPVLHLAEEDLGELSFGYRGGPLAGRHGLAGLQSGDRAAFARTPSPAFALWVVDGTHPHDPAELASATAGLGERFGGLVSVAVAREGTLVPPPPRSSASEALFRSPASSLVHARTAVERPTLLLVRPDGYVAARGALDPGVVAGWFASAGIAVPSA